MKLCNRCVLPQTFPGIRFDERGICQHCTSFEAAKDFNEARARYRGKFLEMLTKLKASPASFHILVAYSGGKDSSYLLKLLSRDLNLRVLALIFDHGFISPRAFENINAVTGALGIDRITVTPDPHFLRRAFKHSLKPDLYPPAALQRASSICNTCMNLVKSYTLKTAIEMGIPLIGYGWSPGQIPLQASVLKINPSMVQQAQQAFLKALQGVLDPERNFYLLRERHFRLLADSRQESGIEHYNVCPLAFSDYEEGAVIDVVEQLGWKAPRDTDTNSTNCLLNGFANQVHLEQLGFHPYALEIANLVRGGFMSREAGIAKLSVPPDERIVAYVKEKLGVD